MLRKLLAKDDVKSRKGAKVAEEKSVNDGPTEEVEAKQEKTSIGKSKKSKSVLPASEDVKSGVRGFGGSGRSKRALGGRRICETTGRAARAPWAPPAQNEYNAQDVNSLSSVALFILSP